MAVPADVVVNYATNPAAASATGYAAVAGTGGTAALSNLTTGGPVVSGTSQNVPTFERVTWSVATTAPSGGASYTQAGLAANQTMPHKLWVRSSKAQTVALTVQYQTAGSVNVGSPLTGTAVALTANTWTALTVTLTSGAAVAQAVLTAAVTAAGANWANGDTFDISAVLIQEPTTRQNLTPNPAMRGTSGTVTVRTNLCTNPSFEVDLTGWSMVGPAGSAIARDTSQFSGGTASMKATWGTGAIDTQAARANVNATSGVTYTMSADVFVPAGQPAVNLLIGTGNETKSAASTVTGAWQRLSVSNTATNTGSAYFDLRPVGAATSGQYAYIDRVMIEAVATVGTYFDGGSAASGDYAYAWTGTANGSTSIQTAKALTNWNGRWFGANGGAGAMFQTLSGMSGGVALRKLWTVANTGASLDTGFNTPSITVAPNAAVTFSGWCRVTSQSSTATTFSPYVNWYNASNTQIGSSSTNGITIQPGVWTQASVTATAPAGTDHGVFVFGPYGGPGGTSASTMAAGDYLDFAQILIEVSGTLGTYFDGSFAQSSTTYYAWEGAADASPSDMMTTPFLYHDGNSSPDASYRYKWQGTANASLVMGEYRGVWVELAAGSGAPGVQVYVSGTGTISGKVQITRTADNETWTVPGWNNRVVIDADTLLDSVAPLGRTVTYTAYLNGAQLNQMTITVPSATGWVQDPWDPSTAMPVDAVFTTTAHLCLAADAMGQRVHGSDVAHGMLMGSKRQYALTNTRQMDDSVSFSMFAHQNDVSDAFRALVANTPILLFRGLPSWGSIPGLAYTDGPAKETMLNRQRVVGNLGTTHWDVTGPLIQPVTRQPLVSTATYTQMATALANTTYTTIAARSGSKRYIDIKANPLGL